MLFFIGFENVFLVFYILDFQLNIRHCSSIKSEGLGHFRLLNMKIPWLDLCCKRRLNGAKNLNLRFDKLSIKIKLVNVVTKRKLNYYGLLFQEDTTPIECIFGDNFRATFFQPQQILAYFALITLFYSFYVFSKAMNSIKE